MKTFAERLQDVLEKKGLSQKEAALKCGVSQQSINYILKKNVESSKLAAQLAEGLEINPNWLIYGEGRLVNKRFYELPIIHSMYMLNKYLNQELLPESLEYTITDQYLGEYAFAYMLGLKQMVLCFDLDWQNAHSVHYLTFKDPEVIVTQEAEHMSFPIFEWRFRDDGFK